MGHTLRYGVIKRLVTEGRTEGRTGVSRPILEYICYDKAGMIYGD